jgi:hypothetical protein
MVGSVSVMPGWNAMSAVPVSYVPGGSVHGSLVLQSSETSVGACVPSGDPAPTIPPVAFRGMVEAGEVGSPIAGLVGGGADVHASTAIPVMRSPETRAIAERFMDTSQRVE